MEFLSESQQVLDVGALDELDLCAFSHFLLDFVNLFIDVSLLLLKFFQLIKGDLVEGLREDQVKPPLR